MKDKTFHNKLSEIQITIFIKELLIKIVCFIYCLWWPTTND